MIVLGLNAYHAEASAALVRDGLLVAAAEEERFARVKHIAGFPSEAVRYCLKEAGIAPEQIDAIAISRNPRAHLWAKAWTAARRGLASRGVQERFRLLQQLGDLRSTLADALGVDPKRLKARLTFVEHHRAHIASSYYPSGWEDALVLSLDGFGDFLSGLWGRGQGNRIKTAGEVLFPHSLGIFYTALTQFLGFREWGDEYKVMGLAAYGKPARYREAVGKLLFSFGEGHYRLALDYFRHHTLGVSMTWASGAPHLGDLFSARLEELLGPARRPEEPVEDRHADIAAAVQERLETAVLNLLQALSRRAPAVSRLCYAGGVALNCALNGKIRRHTPFREIFIQPAAHDAGTSLGAALYVCHHLLGQPRRFVMTHAAWGPEPTETQMLGALQSARIPFRKMDAADLCQTAAQALQNGKILGWFQGRMEFGPRALGHRSLLADPRDPGMKDRINARIKRRELFRPFAPSVMAEAVPSFFPQGHPDRFMLFAYPSDPAEAGRIPAVIHTDGTGRLQAVHRESEPLFWDLLSAFQARTGVPVLLNTSFNEREPIVCRPEEAVDCYRRNAVDGLALGPFWAEQPGAGR